MRRRSRFVPATEGRASEGRKRIMASMSSSGRAVRDGMAGSLGAH